MTEYRFDDLSTAFAYCREADKPVDVIVTDSGRWRLYPSGCAKQRAAREETKAEEAATA